MFIYDEHRSKQTGNFWTQQLINLFFYENWQSYDDIQIDTLIDDMKQQEKIKSTMGQDIDMNQQFPEESLSDFLDRMQKEVTESYDGVPLSVKIYQACNSEPEFQNYIIDLHYQYYDDAVYFFQKYYRQILMKLHKEELKSNDLQGGYVVKLICGYGNGRKNQNHNGLKEKFLEYLSINYYDFVYLVDHGTFLIRAQHWFDKQC
ncbi:UNKNOWN [Stylonychia lemnae]|uniref:Smr domain-containing protein n=1 Tax=Stylonychia lemnae TaxID=5949 RepID=A0A078ALY1_STYLE|nr:UNKNOWN [Stylonychia lemnae]|eukprot:CDW82407.1 UNKNOWN [Stylonychia lemnae]